jgi:hypothetical protein
MDASQRPTAAFRGRRRLRRALIATFVVIGVGAAWAGVALTAHPGTETHDSRAQAAPAKKFPSTPATTVSPSAGRALVPKTDLAGLGWTDFGGIELPVSRSGGPHYVRGDLAWGFADTPLGALLAAVNIGVRANAQWGPDVFGPTIRNQVTGSDAAALLADCRASYEQAIQGEGVPAGQSLGRAYVTEEAFRWVTYTPVIAAVDVVSAGPGDQGTTVRAVTRIEVEWSGTDWQVIAPPGGDWGNSAAPLTSLTGYTRFPVPPASKGTRR